MAHIRLSQAHKEILAELYERTKKTVDELPYTEEYEALYVAFIGRSGLYLTRHDLWRALTNLRKSASLKRKRRAPS